MPAPVRLEDTINRTLPDGWEVRVTSSGRLLYLDHANSKSQWIPPVECWPLKTHLPYGWEQAVTVDRKQYFLNHLKGISTSCHPYILQVEEPAPSRRLVTLHRDDTHGFGFIAGSESPVVVRSVTEDGPSADKLLPGDHILQINGEDVTYSKRLYIIDKIMGATDAVQLLVSQPNLHKDGVRSAFLSHNKKQRLMARPLKVRFADNIRTFSPTAHRVPASLSYLPNILKVYLENGQTKSFRYDGNTTVKVVLDSISTKLGIETRHHLALVTEDVRLSASQRFNILSEDLTLRQVSSQPESQYWRCLFRLTFPPKDAYDLLLKDSSAFDYFYHQCRNDVICERFGEEINFDLALRLASLNIQQHLMKVNKKSVKVSVKMLQKQDGLELFLPQSILEGHKSKELRKQICLHLKQNQTFTPPGQKCLSEVQAKLHYLKIIAELKSFARRSYVVSCRDSEYIQQASECELIVSPETGICKMEDRENNVCEKIADFKDLEALVLSRQPKVEEDKLNAICQIELVKVDGQKLQFVTTEVDGTDFANFVSGLYKVYIDDEKKMLSVDNSRFILDPNSDVPAYLGEHRVIPAGWNYPDVDDYPVFETEEDVDLEYVIDLREGPPSYETVLENKDKELHLSGADAMDSEEVTLDFDSDNGDDFKDANWSLASIAGSDDEDRRSVLSLTDMSFDIRENENKDAKVEEDDGIGQLLFMLKDEFREEQNQVRDQLDGTAKLRKSKSVGDLRERKKSIDSFSSESSSVRSLCLTDFDHSFRNPDISWHGENTLLLGPRRGSSSSQEISGSSFHSPTSDSVMECSANEEEDTIPVSMLDIPSPDPVSSPEVTMEFGLSPPDAFEEPAADIMKAKSCDVAKLDRCTSQRDEEEFEGEGEETLESIAASFQAEQSSSHKDKTSSFSDKDNLKENGTSKTESDIDVHSRQAVKDESLDSLVESFRVNDDVTDSPIVAANKEPLRKAGECGTQSSLRGLVEALIEVTHVVDHGQFSEVNDEDNGTLGVSGEHGYPKSVLEDADVSHDERGDIGVAISEVNLAMPNGSEVHTISSENVAEAELNVVQTPVDSSSTTSLPGSPSHVNGAAEELEHRREAESLNETSHKKDVALANYKQEDGFLPALGVKDLAEFWSTLDKESQNVDTQHKTCSIHETSSLNSCRQEGTLAEGSLLCGISMDRERGVVPGIADGEEEALNIEHLRESLDVVESVREKDSHVDVLETISPTEMTNHELSLTDDICVKSADASKQSLHADDTQKEEPADSQPEEELNTGERGSTVFQPQLLDEAHGIQMAALLALDASMEDKGAANPRLPQICDEEGSDSGNETIASECVVEEPLSRGLDIEMPAGVEGTDVVGGNHQLESFVIDNFLKDETKGDEDERCNSVNPAVDAETLANMHSILFAANGEDVPLISEGDKYVKGPTVPPSLDEHNLKEGIISGGEGIISGEDDPSFTQSEECPRASVQGIHGIDFLIASLTMQPPPGFDDTLTEDLLVTVPPPQFDGDCQICSPPASPEGCQTLDSIEGSKSPSSHDAGEGQSSGPHSEYTSPEESLPIQPPRRKRSLTFVPPVGSTPKSKLTRNEQLTEDGDGSTPTPPPRRRLVKKPKSGNTRLPARRMSERDKSPSEKNEMVPKVLQRSTSFTLGEDETLVDQRFGDRNPKPLQLSPYSSLKNRSSLISGSISKVFSPVRSWSSFKESILSRSRSRPRTSLKSLWPKGNTSEEDTKDEDNCHSMENILTSLDEEKSDDFFATAEIRHRLNSNLRRSESVGGNLQKKTTKEIIPDSKTCESVVFQQEFWRKAEISSPPPTRPAPPVPGHPPISRRHLSLTFLSSNKDIEDGCLRSPQSDLEDGETEGSPTPPPLPKSRPPIATDMDESKSASLPSRGNKGVSEDILKQIKCKNYSSLESVSEVCMDIQMLCHLLETTSNGTANAGMTSESFARGKELLLSEIREFTNNSKMLVTSLNHPLENLISAMDECVHTFARLVSNGQQTVSSLHSELIASRLTHKISDVADHFTGMLQLVIKARGNTNNSNVVQDVLRQAQTMAVLLSSLMRSINMMQNYKQVGNRIVI